MKICYLSDLAFEGSGYSHITINLCQGLVELGHDVKVLGFSYQNEQHPWGFSAIPVTSFNDALATMNNLVALWQPDVIVVGLDIPQQGNMLDNFTKYQVPYIAITPLESGPLCMQWSMSLMRTNKLFVISQYGADEINKEGVSAEHLQIGIDCDVWKKRTPEDYMDARRNLFGIEDDTFIILTVADNQERKNLSGALESLVMFKERMGPDFKFRWVLVTRPGSQIGWKLLDVVVKLDLVEEYVELTRGLPFSKLWSLYAASDAFFLSSKAEGLCVLPETNVWTLTGQKPIEAIKKNDFVFTHAGKDERVSDVFSRHYNGEILKIKPAYGIPEISLTPEHLVYALERKDLPRVLSTIDRDVVPKWTKANELMPGDFVFFPRRSKSFDSGSTISTKSYLSDVVEKGDYIYSIGRNQHNSEFLHPKSKICKSVPINESFLSLLGFYISEGCQTKDGACFSFHSDEIDFHLEVESYLKDLFKLKIKHEVKTRHRYMMWVRGNGSRLFGRLMAELGGKSSYEKHLPNFSFYMPDNLSWALLRSLFLGDGTLTINKKQIALRYSTVSERLAEEIQFLLFQLGVLSSLKRNEKRPEYTVSIHRQELEKIPFLSDFGVKNLPKIVKHSSKAIQLNSGIAIPIKSILAEDYRGLVYNLEVDNDNSYQLAGGAVHNCMPVMEAMSVGVPVVGSAVGAVTEHLSDNRGYLVPSEYEFIDPYGNATRHFMSKEKAADALEVIARGLGKPKSETRAKKARAYIETRTWDIPVAQLDKAIRSIVDVKKPLKEEELTAAII